ncbi:MAG: aldo/keto reductase, partial [Planctomycetota bacterium]
MSDDKPETLSRRGFVRGASAAALGAAVGSAPAAETSAETSAETAAVLPCRVLGKTGLKVTCMTLGTAPAGIAKKIEPPEVARVVNLALDLGINYVDTSPKYGNAEEGVGL